MVKPLVCNFKYYLVNFNFISCNKFGELGVYSDYMYIDKVNRIKDELRKYNKFDNVAILYAFTEISRVYEHDIIKRAFTKEYNFVNPKEKIPQEYDYLITKNIFLQTHKICDEKKEKILKDASNLLKDKTLM